MADNDKILNELFWKKNKSYADQLKKSQIQYEPVSKTSDIKSLMVGNPSDGIIVSDTGEVKKRIVGALGMAMGNNTIKSMASKAIKSFPIIISDDVSPETAVMVKTMMEEQYASYIDLLVSNQIINLTDYETGSEDGNIAIQALNRIDGTDFGKSRLTRQAQSGKLSIDDVFKNSPTWQLLKTNEELNYKTGNPILDLLIENAMIVPTQYENLLVESLYSGDIDPVNDETLKSLLANGETFKDKDVFYNPKTSKTYKRDANGIWNDIELKKKEKQETPNRRLDDTVAALVQKRDSELFSKYNFKNKGDTRSYEKLITPATFINSDDLELSLNRSVAEILSGTNAKNENEVKLSNYLRDRFEKASYLLASYKISGAEYVSYLTTRLGIPVSEKTRINILTKYPASKIVFSGGKMWDDKGRPNIHGRRDLKSLQKAIDASEKYVLKDVIPSVTEISGRDAVAVLAGSAITAGTSTGIMAGLGAAGVAAISAPIFWPVLAASAVVGGVGAAIIRHVQKKKMNKLMTTSIEGWERVESLIDNMDNMRADLIQKMNDSSMIDKDTDEKVNEFMKDEENRRNSFMTKMDNILRTVQVNENITNIKGFRTIINEDQLSRMINDVKSLDEEIKSDDELYSEISVLEESAKYVINTKKPGDIIIKQQKLKNKDIAGIVPSFGTRDSVAYGSVEYDKRDIKDRKFNEPLILTIKFKERYSDGKYADNELTAVIGILGVITRVPSDEMATILKSNAEGKTLNNFFKGDESNNSKDLIGNVISSFMGTKYADKLPTSGKVWANLEKISSLAMANKLSGNNNGNISNAHLVFSQKEIDQVKSETGINYLKNAKLTAQLMKKYSAFMVMVCNDAMQYVYSFSDPDAISWEDAPYSAYMGKSNADQMLSAFTQATRMKL